MSRPTAAQTVGHPFLVAHEALKRLEDRALGRFNQWFTSEGGVYQTLVITLALVLSEHLFPRLDPNGFLLLYWLTVYSAVTQPMLAYAATEGSVVLHRRLDATDAAIAAIAASQTTQGELLASILARLPTTG